MRTRDSSMLPWILTVTVGVVVATVELAGARDKVDEGGMPTQKPVEQPFLKSLVGTWDWTSKTASGVEDKGTDTFRLALLDTAVLEDLEGHAAGMAFQGHGILKVSEAGATLAGWWFFSASPGVQAFQGSLTAEGYDVTGGDGERMTLVKTPTGLELKAFKHDQPTRTVTFTKR